jgi:hypothetical protein
MKQTQGRGPVPFYPFLFALYPALFLYTYNIEETGFRTALGPLAASLALVTVVFLIAWLLVRRVRKAALIAFVFGLLFFSYGHVFNLFKRPPAPLAWIQTGLWTALFIGSIVLIVRLRKDPLPATRLLNVFSAVLVLLAASQIAWSGLAVLRVGHKHPSAPEDQVILENRVKPPLGYLPDIYFLIFDRYCGPVALKDYYKFDNTPFLKKLKSRRFSTAVDSRCGYAGTYLSLTSTLNMEYIDNLFPKLPVHKRSIYHLLQDHRVGRLLKALGYTYYHIGSWYEGTKRNPYADDEFRPSGLTTLNQDFLIKFADSTWLNLLLKGHGLVSRDYQHREGVKQQFARLAQIAVRSGPKFVFLHMLVPHFPFVFGPNGENFVIDRMQSPAVCYLNQIKFINMRILRLIRTIRLSSRRQPVIILQADEGAAEEEAPRASFARLKGKLLKMARAQVRYNILDAWSFPSGIMNRMPRGMSPVNTFRIVFNRCFGTAYPLLPDLSFKFTDNRTALKSVEAFPRSYFRFTKRMSDELRD